MIAHQFHPTILRLYDIRGIISETLSDTDAYMLGLGFAEKVREQGGRKIVVGRDGRLSSPSLSNSLIHGLTEGGMWVVDIGICPTPCVYFADIHLEADAAIVVTGSHNPSNHNGFKLVLGHKPFFADDITSLGQRVAKGVETKRGGEIHHLNLQADYIKAMTDSALGDNENIANAVGDMNIVWDCGNGVTGPTILELVSQIPGQHHVLFAEIDGNFPNHHPDPVAPETLDTLRDTVFTYQADLGIAFDGDGDRIGLIDAKGRHITGDILTVFLARRYLRRQPDASIILDVKASQVALDLISMMGGKPILWKTGHSYIKAKLKSENAVLAGEMSGHIFIADDYFGFDDGLYAALAVLREIAEMGENITDFIDGLPPVYVTAESRLPCLDEVKFDIITRIRAFIESQDSTDIMSIMTIDGLRVNYNDGWWLIRASNTGAELVMRAEGKDETSQVKMLNHLRQALKEVNLI